MRQVSVLIDLRGILGGVVTRLLRDKYGEAAVHEVLPGTFVTDAIEAIQPAIVVLSDLSVVQPQFAGILAEHPRMRMLIVESDGRTGSLWHRTSLGELSVRRIIETIDSELQRDE